MIEVFFDCSSPWTYLAFHNVQPLAAEFGETIVWKPILVGGVFNAVNKGLYDRRSDAPPRKYAHMLKDLADWSRLAGLTIKMPPTVFPVNSVKAMRGCIVMQDHGRMVEFATAVFEIYWAEDQDISQDAVLAEVCRRVGVDAAWLFGEIAKPEIKDRLRANVDELIERGGYGSPTIFVGGDDMYFGNDRLPLVRDALARARARAA
jgi:2-hydroxychromene-2-carboxylate isomerase